MTGRIAGNVHAQPDCVLVVVYAQLDDFLHQPAGRALVHLVRRMGRERPVSDRVRSLLLSRAATPPTADEAADYLGRSPRTLRRHLQDEGTSYVEQVNQLRLDLAYQYLSIEKRAVKDVAAELGFRDASAFRRAFKQWNGRTVGEFLQGA